MKFRAFAAFGNYPESRSLIESQFADIETVLQLIEVALRAGQDDTPEHWFPNNIAAESLLLRAYQGLQAAANLCALGFYVESLATLRPVYESAGLARTLAHKPEKAERWLHGGDWVKDKYSKDFVQEMTGKDATDDRVPHWDLYKIFSQYAHPMLTSAWRFIFTPDAQYQPCLYPSVDPDRFTECTRMIKLIAVFVAATVRNAAADFGIFQGG